VRLGALTDTFQVRLAKFLREFLRQTERNGESIRRSDRQNANIAWAEFDLKVLRWYVMRIAESLCARLIALDAILGKVISNADSVSIVRIIAIVRPAISSTSNLTAVPSAAVSKLISLRTSMSFVTVDGSSVP